MPLSMPLLVGVQPEYLLFGGAGAISLLAFAALIVAPAMGSYGRAWEKAMAAVLSLFVRCQLSQQIGHFFAARPLGSTPSSVEQPNSPQFGETRQKLSHRPRHACPICPFSSTTWATEARVSSRLTASPA